MPRSWTPRSTLLALAALALTACTVVPPREVGPASPTPTPAPTTAAPADPATARTRLPDDPVVVLDGADGVARAVQASRAVYARTPVAVLAPADDVAAQLRAASAAVALGAPLLLSGPDEVPDAVADEVRRLRADAVLAVGDVPARGLPDDVVVPAPADDDALGDVVRRELAPPEPDAATTDPADPRAAVAAVAALDRDEPVLLGPPAPDAGPAPTASPTPTPTPSGAAAHVPGFRSGPEPADDAPALPRTTPPDPLADGVVLTLGAAEDLAAVATARAAGLDVVLTPDPDPRAVPAVVDALAAAAPTTTLALGPAFGPPDDLAWRVETAATGVHLPGGGQVLFPGRRMVATYGTPGSTALGLLGEQELPDAIATAQRLARAYRPLTDEPVVPAFEIIATIASAGAGDDGNYSDELPPERFLPWVEAAQEAGVYVVLDLQPGRTDFLTQAKAYEELLRHPNVGLALDPEWRLEPDQVHLRQIGSVTAAEVNLVVDWLADLTRAHRLPQKLLILHQFSLRMITDRQDVDTTRPELAVLIHADGQGTQPAKAGTWRALHQDAPPHVWWGWKNFIDEDSPTLTPEQTYAIRPRPWFVSYQ